MDLPRQPWQLSLAWGYLRMLSTTFIRVVLYRGIRNMARVVDARGLGFEHGQFYARERARRGSSHACSVSIDTYDLVDQHSFRAPTSLLVGGVVTEHSLNCSDDRSTYKFSLL